MCKVTHQTFPATLLFDDVHLEKANFLFFEYVHHSLIPGFPWLKYNPHVDRTTGSVSEWGRNFVEHCVMDQESPLDGSREVQS